MAQAVKLLDYTGPVVHKTIDQLLKKLIKTEAYLSLDRTTAKRVYGILVECLENISKHSEKNCLKVKIIHPIFL
jgi:signal transduction histidine kinase